ncbi:MAG: hypothetical protein OJF49_002109 [Ktedonobacterales bacterium]|nr:MAG: hypothetical protein OJF49_002109 [Ktedonobacterales bacterium]
MMFRGGGRGEMMAPGGQLGQAKLALASGQLEKAEAICRKRLERNPSDSGTRVLLAQALVQQRRVDEGIEEARRAIADQGTNVDAHLVLSSALLQKSGSMFGRIPPEAERAARRAVQLQPRAAKTHVQLAEVLAAKREMPAARAEADVAVQLEPRLAGAHLIRAIVLLSDKDPEGALQASDAALRNDRTLTQADLIKANAYLELKRYDESLAAIDSVERQNPLLAGSSTEAMRGRIYFKQRKFKKSYNVFLKLQRMNPRMRWLAPVTAGVSTVLVGQFGQDAQWAMLVLAAIVIFLVLFGLHFIPVVGPWLVAVLILALAGVFVVGGLQQGGVNLLSGPLAARLPKIGIAVVGFLAVFLIALYLVGAVARGLFHNTHWTLDPPSLVIAGVVGMAGAAAISYLFQRYAFKRA